MKTIIEFAWTVYSSAALIDAIQAAELVGIDVRHSVFFNSFYYDRALHLSSFVLTEMYMDSFYRIIDKCGGYVAVQHNNDYEITCHIDYARKHGIPTAVWQL